MNRPRVIHAPGHLKQHLQLRVKICQTLNNTILSSKMVLTVRSASCTPVILSCANGLSMTRKDAPLFRLIVSVIIISFPDADPLYFVVNVHIFICIEMAVNFDDLTRNVPQFVAGWVIFCIRDNTALLHMKMC